MPSLLNELLVKEYKDRFADSSNLISVGYERMNIKSTNALRAQLEERKTALRFVKNRLICIAFKELEKPDIKPLCIGQTALIETGEDPVSMARFLVDFAKEHPELTFHGAIVENTVIDSKGVITLSKSPTKEELKGQISGQVLNPGATLSGALIGTGSLIASQIKSMIDKEEEGEAA